MAQFQRLVKQHGSQAIKVALLVGSVLILVNQYHAIFSDEPFRIWSALVTYFVPFAVFLFGRRTEC